MEVQHLVDGRGVGQDHLLLKSLGRQCRLETIGVHTCAGHQSALVRGRLQAIVVLLSAAFQLATLAISLLFFQHLLLEEVLVLDAAQLKLDTSFEVISQ